MAYENNELKVDHENHRFEMETKEGTAFIDFTQDGSTVTLVHTEAPEDEQGQGVGSALIEKTLSYLGTHHMEVIPQCKSVKAYIDNHSEWNKLVTS